MHTHGLFAPAAGLPAAPPVNVATGATFVDCALLADTARVRLGSALHVAPCATETVVIVIAGKAADEGEVVADITVGDAGEWETVAAVASEIAEIGVEPGREKVLAYQTELGTGTTVIVVTETTDVDVVEVDQ
jgi:hypothetical protein